MMVQDFIAAELARPFTWGKSDCAAMADRWVQATCGFSPLDTFGRRYRDETEARQWLAEPGSIAVAVNRVMRAAGFKKTAKPRTGDVGLVFHEGRLCVAILAPGSVWVFRDEAGLIGVPPAHAWKAWRIECRQQ
jgi:hypothetical protein